MARKAPRLSSLNLLPFHQEAPTITSSTAVSFLMNSDSAETSAPKMENINVKMCTTRKETKNKILV